MGSSDELNYYNDVIQHLAADGRLQSEDGISALGRFQSLLVNIGRDDGSIVLQEHWAFLCECLGDYSLAIVHREREIELVETLFSIGGPVGSVDYSFLSRELYRLAEDYLQVGESEKAKKVFQRIENLRLS